MFKESNNSHRHENNDTEKATQVLVLLSQWADDLKIIKSKQNIPKHKTFVDHHGPR